MSGRLVLAASLLLVSCFPRNAPLEPCLHHPIAEHELRTRPSPFPSLTKEEQVQDWAVEYTVGNHFAKELDLYRAITAYKRALFLIPPRHQARELEVTYNIALSYYLGDRYNEAIQTIEESPLAYTDDSFPAYHDLLTLLHDAYNKTGQHDKACRVFTALTPTDQQRVTLSTALLTGDVDTLASFPSAAPVLDTYCACAKSVTKAQALSAIFPGAGFWYIGQKQSAITAFALNALFIAAAYQFFHNGYIAAAIVTTSLEIGWYVGNIYGAGEGAHEYNARLWERAAAPALEGGMYPCLMLKWGF